MRKLVANGLDESRDFAAPGHEAVEQGGQFVFIPRGEPGTR